MLPSFTSPLKKSSSERCYYNDNINSKLNDDDDDIIGSSSSSTNVNKSKTNPTLHSCYITPLMTLASSHVISQSLRVFVELNMAEIIHSLSSSSSSSSPYCSATDVAREIRRQQKKQQYAKNILFEDDDSDKNDCQRIEELRRILRLLASVGILDEDQLLSNNDDHNNNDDDFVFRLTPMGQLLRPPSDDNDEINDNDDDDSSRPSLASCVRHWTERPLWNSWLELSDYLSGATTTITKSNDNNDHLRPFTRANDGITADDYYSRERNPKSLSIANDFVRAVSDGEISAIVNEFDWTRYAFGEDDDDINDDERTTTTKDNNNYYNLTLVDVGGYDGRVMRALKQRYPGITAKCLDLPSVVERFGNKSEAKQQRGGVELVGGDVMNATTIPPCDVIFMKHFLDKSMWNEEESVMILKSCHAALGKGRVVKERGGDDGRRRHLTKERIIIAETVLPGAGGERGTTVTMPGMMEGSSLLQLAMDVQFILVGRGSGRTRDEWHRLVDRAGFEIENIVDTSLVSCSLIVLKKK